MRAFWNTRCTRDAAAPGKKKGGGL